MKYIFLFLSFTFTSLFAQDSQLIIPTQKGNNYEYDVDLLSPQFHAEKRQALRDSMPKNSVAVLFANPVRNRSNDVNYEYHQDPNFYYLTGLREPHAVVFIFKEEQEFSNGIKTDELLFYKKEMPLMKYGQVNGWGLKELYNI